MIAMRSETEVFNYSDVLADEFDLLIYLWFFIDNGEFLAFALGARVQCDFDGQVDLVAGERLSLMCFVSFLCSDFALAFSFAFPLLGRFNDIGGGRFGGVTGVLFEFSDFGFRGRQSFRELRDTSR